MKKEYIEVATPGGVAYIRSDGISSVLEEKPFDKFPKGAKSYVCMRPQHGESVYSTETAKEIYKKIEDSYEENHIDSELRNCFVFITPSEKEVKSYCHVHGRTVDEAVANAMNTMYILARYELFDNLRHNVLDNKQDSRFRKSEKYPLRWNDCSELNHPNFIEPLISGEDVNPIWLNAKGELYFNVRNLINAKIGIMTIWPGDHRGSLPRAVVAKAEKPIEFEPNTVEAGWIRRHE